jgi:hypothetical protein
MVPGSIKREVVIDIYVDYVYRAYFNDPHILQELHRIGVKDKNKFIAMWQAEKDTICDDYRDSLLKFGLKYNWVFNERLGRPPDYPTWQLFLHEIFKKQIERYRPVIEREHSNLTIAWRASLPPQDPGPLGTPQ